MIFFSNLFYYPLTIRRKDKKSHFVPELVVDNGQPLSERSYLHKFRANCDQGRAELLACVTMYNEPFSQLRDSLGGFLRSYAELITINRQKYEGRVAVVCIADGFEKLPPEFLNEANDYGIFDVDTMSEYFVDNLPANPMRTIESMGKLPGHQQDYETNNIGHCFARKVNFGQLLRGHQIEGTDANQWITEGLSMDSIPPIDFFFVIKHKNSGKIESHLWFFKGFCSYFNPKLTQLIDIGTLPLQHSISKMAMYMDMEVNVGGCCGEIEVLFPKDSSCTETCIVAAQYVEYKLSHYLDKAYESFFGFVSVLPGAFSMFRWDAIQGAPLDRFFKGLNKGGHSAFEANMYLAEDRIMCLEILIKRGENWILKYVPSCRSLTDPPTRLSDLLKQRRRWTNGSLFAAFYCMMNFCQVNKSSHSCCRKFIIYILFTYYLCNMVLTLSLVGSFYAVFSIFIRSLFPSDACQSFYHVSNILENIYLIVIFVILIISTTRKVNRSEEYYQVSAAVLGLFMVATIVSAIFHFFVKGEDNSLLTLIFILGAILSYILPVVMHCNELSLCKFALGTVYKITAL